MTVYSPITTCARSAIHIKRHIGTNLCAVISRGSSKFSRYSFYSGHPRRKYVGLDVSLSNAVSSSSDISFQTSCGSCFPSCFSKQRGKFLPLITNQSSSLRSHKGQLKISFVCPSAKKRFLVPKQEAAKNKEGNKDEHDRTDVKLYNGKRVYTDYSIIGIPGDGRCLFRSVAHRACLRSGRPAPSESLQRELADELRARVSEELIKRREETEWFVEGDFDSYVSQIRKPHVWGGEPELFMASHVLQMPITVYMHDEKASGLICIAEYGQEYGKGNPIRVIYHGFGHYDALQIHERKAAKSKL